MHTELGLHSNLAQMVMWMLHDSTFMSFLHGAQHQESKMASHHHISAHVDEGGEVMVARQEELEEAL